MIYLVTLLARVPHGVPKPKKAIREVVLAALQEYAAEHGLGVNPTVLTVEVASNEDEDEVEVEP